MAITSHHPQEGTIYSEGTDVPVSRQEAIIDAIAQNIRGGYIPTTDEIQMRYALDAVLAVSVLARARAKAGK